MVAFSGRPQNSLRLFSGQKRLAHHQDQRRQATHPRPSLARFRGLSDRCHCRQRSTCHSRKKRLPGSLECRKSSMRSKKGDCCSKRHRGVGKHENGAALVLRRYASGRRELDIPRRPAPPTATGGLTPSVYSPAWPGQTLFVGGSFLKRRGVPSVSDRWARSAVMELQRVRSPVSACVVRTYNTQAMRLASLSLARCGAH